MPYKYLGSIYRLPETLGIGDRVAVEGIVYVVANWKRIGTFDGKGYDRYTLVDTSENQFFGYH